MDNTRYDLWVRPNFDNSSPGHSVDWRGDIRTPDTDFRLHVFPEGGTVRQAMQSVCDNMPEGWAVAGGWVTVGDGIWVRVRKVK